MALRIAAALGAIVLTGLTACAGPDTSNPPAPAATIAPKAAPPAVAVLEKAPPGGNYRKVSDLVRFPDFYPGLGTLYVQPNTLPVGPFQAYDHKGDLVSTIYMVPTRDFDAHKGLDNLPSSPLPVNHVDMYFNSGHPGVDEPHYHIVLWHISPEQAESLNQ